SRRQLARGAQRGQVQLLITGPVGQPVLQRLQGRHSLLLCWLARVVARGSLPIWVVPSVAPSVARVSHALSVTRRRSRVVSRASSLVRVSRASWSRAFVSRAFVSRRRSRVSVAHRSRAVVFRVSAPAGRAHSRRVQRLLTLLPVARAQLVGLQRIQDAQHL